MTTPEVSIIVPTFREAKNVPELLRRIDASMRDDGLPYEVIIVDDNSNDGIQDACGQLNAQFPVKLIVRTHERGLSSAVVTGLKAAIGTTLVVMDADLSHPPEAIPELVAALQNPENDFVIGSRYVKGGSTEEGWGLFRYLNSKLATLLAMPLTSVNDPMAGFFALRRETFESADQLNAIGYKIGLELLVKCNCRGVVEVPIHFANRKHGESKLSFREQVNYLRHLRRLYAYRFFGGRRKEATVASEKKSVTDRSKERSLKSVTSV